MLDTTSKTFGVAILAICHVAVAVLPTFSGDDSRVREAAERAVRLVERMSSEFLKTRDCFTCHTQTLSVMVLRAARDRGFDVDRQNLERQIQRVSELHQFVKRREQGSLRVDTVGYGLWALDIGDHPPDRMTADMTWYLLNYQKDLGHWKTTVHRPPTEASNFATNYVAVRGLNRYGTAEQQDEIATRIAAVKQWLSTAVVVDTEDQVFRLRLADELRDVVRKDSFIQRLIGEQHDTGGWAQKPDMQSDAYATGSTLVTLHEVGGISMDDLSWQRGLDFLLRTQKPDGSWHVVTRSEPEQVYFESGFPHGKDQFISAFATGWATTALLQSLHEAGR